MEASKCGIKYFLLREPERITLGVVVLQQNPHFLFVREVSRLCEHPQLPCAISNL